jgi:hypothetical protein
MIQSLSLSSEPPYASLAATISLRLGPLASQKFSRREGLRCINSPRKTDTHDEDLDSQVSCRRHDDSIACLVPLFLAELEFIAQYDHEPLALSLFNSRWPFPQAYALCVSCGP